VQIISFGGHAHGFIAIGQVATGVIAIGQLARGVITIGQLSLGLIAVGQLGGGLLWCGGIGVGATGNGLVWGVFGRMRLDSGRITRPRLVPRGGRRTPLRLAARGVVVAALLALWLFVAVIPLAHDLPTHDQPTAPTTPTTSTTPGLR
jgi:hypothetical protein